MRERARLVHLLPRLSHEEEDAYHMRRRIPALDLAQERGVREKEKEEKMRGLHERSSWMHERSS